MMDIATKLNRIRGNRNEKSNLTYRPERPDNCSGAPAVPLAHRVRVRRSCGLAGIFREVIMVPGYVIGFITGAVVVMIIAVLLMDR